MRCVGCETEPLTSAHYCQWCGTRLSVHDAKAFMATPLAGPDHWTHASDAHCRSCGGPCANDGDLCRSCQPVFFSPHTLGHPAYGRSAFNRSGARAPSTSHHLGNALWCAISQTFYNWLGGAGRLAPVSDTAVIAREEKQTIVEERHGDSHSTMIGPIVHR